MSTSTKVLCTGACGTGTAGVTRHNSDSAAAAACSMSSTRRSRKAGTTTAADRIAAAPRNAGSGVTASTSGPDWTDRDVTDPVVDGMLGIYRDEYGEDSDAFRLTKKFRKEMDYRLVGGLKEEEPSPDFDGWANRFLHDPKFQELVESEFSMEPEEAREAIDDLESRIRHPENIEATSAERQQRERAEYLEKKAGEAEALYQRISELQKELAPLEESLEEIKAEFRGDAVAFAQEHDKEWMVVGPVQARFTPDTVLNMSKLEEKIPKNQRKALLKPATYDPKMVREWLKNNPKLKTDDYLEPGNGRFSFKVVLPESDED